VPLPCSPTASFYCVICVSARATRRANSDCSDCPTNVCDTHWVCGGCMRREARLSAFSLASCRPYFWSSLEAVLNWQSYPFENCFVFLCRVARTLDPRGSCNVNDWHACRLHPEVSAHLCIPFSCAHWVRGARLFCEPIGLLAQDTDPRCAKRLRAWSSYPLGAFLYHCGLSACPLGC
jgi:hypothetical protein